MNHALIPGFPAYRVFPTGVIESRWRTGQFYSGFETEDVWAPIKKNQRPDGYYALDLRDGRGKSRRTYAHILVAELFIGPKPFSGAVVRHLDGDPSNNNVSNLAWGTYKENEDDKRRHGTWQHRSNGKLSRQQRDAIRSKAANGISQRLLAEQYCVSRPTITRLLNGSIWSEDLCAS